MNKRLPAFNPQNLTPTPISEEKKAQQYEIISATFGLENISEEIEELQKKVNEWSTKYPKAKVIWLQSQNGNGYSTMSETRLTAIIAY